MNEVLDRPDRFVGELPEQLTLRWVQQLTLPPAPRPVLLWSATGSTATPAVVQALAWRLAGREVGFLHVGNVALELLDRVSQANRAASEAQG